jgi:predicted nucleic acid-binding protein
VREKVFLDSGIFIAFINRRDQWHSEASLLFRQDSTHWSTSFLVVSETYSWFLHRMGEEIARNFHILLQNMTGLKLLEISHTHHDQVLSMLRRFRGSKLSYVDASSLCFIDTHKIHCVWSTDHHLGLTGAQVLPRI